MQQTIERSSGRSRPGFLRRLLIREPGKATEAEPAPAEPPITPTTIIDLRGDLPAARWRATVSERLERLDTGLSLVAETMKRAFVQVFRSIEDHRGSVGSSSEGDLERIVGESFSSLESAVEDLAESIRRLPYVLAAAADDISAQVEAASSGPGGDDQPFQQIPAGPDHSAPPELLPATPFELEPIDEQFAPMDEASPGIEAARIWESG